MATNHIALFARANNLQACNLSGFAFIQSSFHSRCRNFWTQHTRIPFFLSLLGVHATKRMQIAVVPPSPRLASGRVLVPRVWYSRLDVLPFLALYGLGGGCVAWAAGSGDLAMLSSWLLLASIGVSHVLTLLCQVWFVSFRVQVQYREARAVAAAWHCFVFVHR